MNDRHRPGSPIPAMQPNVEIILWGAILSSMLLFAAVGWFVVSQGLAGTEVRLAPAVQSTLNVSALVLWLLALALPRYLKSPEKVRALHQTPEEQVKTGKMVLAVSWALGEAGVLMGFVMMILAGNFPLFLPYLGAGVLVHVLNFPRLHRYGGDTQK